MDKDEKNFLAHFNNEIFDLEISVADYLANKFERQYFFKILASKVFGIAMDVIKYHQTYVDKSGH